MLEKTIEKHCRDRFKDEKLGLCLKLRSLGFFSRSFPDRTCLWRGGYIHFIEFKQLGEKPTKLQNACHKILRGLGFKVFVIDSKEGVDAHIEEYKRKFFDLLL